MDQYIGKMLDNRYEILEVIGTGGMAVVYKARCHRLNRLVAIKILRDDLAKDAEFRRRFHDESQAVAMLSHPNIVAVYDVSRGSELEYIVMELIDGITLKQYMQKKGEPLNWREALHFSTQIMKALSHAHGRGIIHRDIKPQNIMVLRDGSIKVADFGIARLASAAQSTLTQEALGSVHYISPEQAKGSRIDARSDIYSAGVVLYEMLSGRLPFEGDTPVSVAIQHINSIPLAPKEINPDIPDALEAITLKAMASNVEKRYINADAMMADLEEFRKNPSINFDYSPEDLFKGGGEPSQMMNTSAHRRYSTNPGSDRDRWRSEPEEEDDYEERRRRNRGRGGSSLSIPLAVAAILLFVVGIGVLLWVTFFSELLGVSKTPAEHKVPVLVGKMYTEVMADPAITNMFEIVQGATMNSNEYEAGEITAQDPESGKTVKGERPAITVTISGGADMVTIPPLINRDYTEAILELQQLGLKVATPPTYQFSETINRSYIISLTPLDGTRVPKGTEVQLVVSQGPEVKPVTVISFLDMTLVEAKAKLELLNLKMGKEVPVASEKPIGTVLSQSIPANEEVPEGTAINFEVSTGPAEVSPSPDVSPSPSPSEPGTTPPISPEPSVPASGGSTNKVTTQPIKIKLPEGEYETIKIRIEVDGVSIYDNLVPHSLGSEVSISIQGSGVQKVDIYLDGSLSESRTVDFTTSKP